MKKFLVFLLAISLGVMTISAESKSNVKTFSDGVSAVHEDLTGSIATIHDDAKGIITTIYKDSKGLAKVAYPEIKEAVSAIGKALGVAAEHVYIVLVKKYVVDGVHQLLIFLIGIVLLVVGWIKLNKYIKTSPKINWHVLYPSAMVIAGIICTINVDYQVMFMGLINPEYGAIDYILNFTKGLGK